jgi:hypothetical protein
MFLMVFSVNDFSRLSGRVSGRRSLAKSLSTTSPVI